MNGNERLFPACFKVPSLAVSEPTAAPSVQTTQGFDSRWPAPPFKCSCSHGMKQAGVTLPWLVRGSSYTPILQLDLRRSYANQGPFGKGNSVIAMNFAPWKQKSPLPWLKRSIHVQRSGHRKKSLSWIIIPCISYLISRMIRTRRKKQSLYYVYA